MALTILQLDVRIARGTYLITTSNGSHYTVSVNGRASGPAGVSDGAFFPHTTTAALNGLAVGEALCGPVIRVGKVMVFTDNGCPGPTTTKVTQIRRIDGLPELEINRLKLADTTEASLPVQLP